MTKQEFGRFVMALKTYYPRESALLPNSQSIELWFNQLKDLDYITAEKALNKWVKENKWSPSIAEIRQATEAEIRSQKLRQLLEHNGLFLEVNE